MSEYIGVRGEIVGCDAAGNPFYNMYLTDEEVIRCRDCAHMFEMMDGFECERMSGQYHACDPNGFCAWAERRMA